MQFKAAAWRSLKFESIESKVDDSQRANLFGKASRSIHDLWLRELQSLPGAPPVEFLTKLNDILASAYEWNRVAKMEMVKYDFEPFICEAGLDYNPAKMEPFELGHSIPPPETKVISPVSLGFSASVALGGRRESFVQHKCTVLVKQWFTAKSRVREQPGPTQPMVIRHAHADAGQQQSPQGKKKKKICC